MPIEWTDQYHEWTQNYRLEDDGSITTATFMDAEPILENAKAEHNAGFGSSPSGDLKKVASIPMGLWLKWKQEDGVDILKPGTDGFLRRKLDDPEYWYLRIWGGKLGKHHLE